MVVGNVQTGIHLYGNQSLVQGRLPVFPSQLDSSAIGLASWSNTLFDEILFDPITRDWQKEGPFTYRGPAGTLYVYDSTQGTFSPGAGGESDEGRGESLDDILDTFEDLVFYRSGSIVDRTSSLAYVPDYVSGSVALTLASGTHIEKRMDGSATVVLPDRRVFEIPDVKATGTPVRISFSRDDKEGLLTIQGGEVFEWEEIETILEDNSRKDPETHTDYRKTLTHREYHYSGGTLDTARAMVFKTQVLYTVPEVVQTSYLRKNGGAYEGNTETSHESATESVYGAHTSRGLSRTAYGYTTEALATYSSHYAYDPETRNYRDIYSGTHRYSIHSRSMRGSESTWEDAAIYDGEFRKNRGTGNYDGSIHYRHDDGRDYSTEYEYNASTKTYTSVFRDHRTGLERRSSRRH